MKLHSLGWLTISILILGVLSHRTGWQNQFADLVAVGNFLEGQPLQSEPTTSLQARILAQDDPIESVSWLISLQDHTSILNQFRLCQLFWQSNQIEAAIAACQSAQVPAQYWINQGLASVNDPQLSKALAFYQMATNVDPADPEAWLRLGSIQVRLGQYEAAITALEKALALEYKSDPALFIQLGRAYRLSGDSQNSQRILEQGVEFFPTAQLIYFELGELFSLTEDWQSTETLYADLTKYSPENAAAWSRRARAALRLGRTDDAQRYFQNAVDLEPTSINYQMDLAEAATLTEDWRTVADAYDKVLTLAPTEPRVLLTIGDFFRQNGDIEQAIALYNQILNNNPEHPGASVRLAELNGSP